MWRVELDSITGDPKTNTFKNKLMVVDSVRWHADNQFVGMRAEMELDGNGSDYWIHCIYRQISYGKIFYLRVSPDDTLALQA